MKVYMAFKRGENRRVRAKTIACACRIIGDDGTVHHEFHDDSGSDELDHPYRSIVYWVREAVEMLASTPSDEAISFFISSDTDKSGAEYVIKTMNDRLGDYYLSKGIKRDGKPVSDWEKWKEIAEFSLSRTSQPTWNYAQNEPGSIFVANAVEKLVL